jgi:uncharacterized lipoprotein YmbA
MIPVRHVWLPIGWAVALTLGACHSAPTRIYSLEAVAPATRLATYQAPALRVDALSVPASWDRIEMLSPSERGSFQISDFDHWSASLAQAARQALSADLDQRLPPGNVIYPRLPKTVGALGVTVDILEFNIVAAKASMQASWLIVPAEGLPGAKRGVAFVETPMISTEPASVARAWGALLGQLADRIAADAASFTVPLH